MDLCAGCGEVGVTRRCDALVVESAEFKTEWRPPCALPHGVSATRRNRQRLRGGADWRHGAGIAASVRTVCALLVVAAYICGMEKQKHQLTDIPTEYEEVRAKHPHIPDFAWSIMLRYTPQKPVTPAVWEVVRPFTISTAAEMEPGTYDVTRRLMTTTAHFHAWVWAGTGAQLDVFSTYTQDNIDRYLHSEHKRKSADHRWGVSRQLVKIGRELADADLLALPAPDGKPRPPFTTKEIASMHSWANSLSTSLKRRNAWALLGLAGGAGLTTTEIADARVSDIHRDGTVVFVDVRGANARRVPVRNSWARVLLRSVEGRERADELLFHGHRFAEYPPRAIQTFLTENRASVRPTPMRLRNSWLLHHINNNVPPQILREVSGIVDYQTLMRYYAHAERRSVADYYDLLTGAPL